MTKKEEDVDMETDEKPLIQGLKGQVLSVLQKLVEEPVQGDDAGDPPQVFHVSRFIEKYWAERSMEQAHSRSLIPEVQCFIAL